MSTGSRISAVLFDLDDTLLNSFTARMQSLQDVFSQANILNTTAEQFLRGLHGTVFKDALERLQTEQNIKDDLFISYRRIYWNKEPMCQEMEEYF